MENNESDKHCINLSNKAIMKLDDIFRKRFTHPKVRNNVQCILLRNEKCSLDLLALMLR